MIKSTKMINNKIRNENIKKLKKLYSFGKLSKIYTFNYEIYMVTGVNVKRSIIYGLKDDFTSKSYDIKIEDVDMEKTIELSKKTILILEEGIYNY